MTSTNDGRPAISAHRGGRERARAGTWEAFTASLDAGAEYVEFDVRFTADRAGVVHHDALAGGRPVHQLSHRQLNEVSGYEVPTATAVMELIAGRAMGHLDLKDDTDEHSLVGAAIDILGVDGFVTTTENAESIRRIRSFAPRVRTAFSTGHRVRGRERGARRRSRNRPFDARMVTDAGAHWVALNHRVATPHVLRTCRRGGIGVMVWTVNSPERIAHFLADSTVDVVITDRPYYANHVRDKIADR